MAERDRAVRIGHAAERVSERVTAARRSPRRIAAMAYDPRWEMLERARPALLSAFADQGVVKIEYVAAWPELDGVGVWLCTLTDVARDAIGVENPGRADVETILHEYGLDDRDLRPGRFATTAQSQETVD